MLNQEAFVVKLEIDRSEKVHTIKSHDDMRAADVVW